MKQTILVTGASSGIGLFIANKLHNSGYDVIGTSRNPEKYQNGYPFKLLALDIADDSSIESFIGQLFSLVGRLDVLINNAEFMLTGLAEETSIELGKELFDINFWGTMSLTHEVLRYFRKQRGGQIITIGSFFGLIGHPGATYYSASKHALEGYFKSLRFEMDQFNIKVSMVEPMFFKTDIDPNAISDYGEVSVYDEFRQKINNYYRHKLEKAPEPTPVADTVLKIINIENPKFNYTVGKGASLTLALQRIAYKALENCVLKRINVTK